MKKNILFLVITIYLIYCKDYRIEITSLSGIDGVIQEPVYLYFTDINSKAMSDILKDSSKVQLNFLMFDFCDGECDKCFFVELNDVQINGSENDQLNAGDLYLQKYISGSSSNVDLLITLLDKQVDTDYIRNKIGKVKNFEDLESLF